MTSEPDQRRQAESRSDAHTEQEGTPPLDKGPGQLRRPREKKAQLHRHRLCCFPFSVKPWLLQLLFKTESFKGRTCCHTTVRGGRGSTEPAEELPEGPPLLPSLRARLDPHGCGRPGGQEGAGKGCLLFRMKASRSTPHIHGASWLDVVVVRSGEGLPAGQALDGGAALPMAGRPGQRLRPCSPPLSLPEA